MELQRMAVQLVKRGEACRKMVKVKIRCVIPLLPEQMSPLSSVMAGQMLTEAAAPSQNTSSVNDNVCLADAPARWNRGINPYPTAFPYGNGMVLHFYQQQESSTTKIVHKVINKGLKTYV